MRTSINTKRWRTSMPIFTMIITNMNTDQATQQASRMLIGMCTRRCDIPMLTTRTLITDTDMRPTARRRFEKGEPGDPEGRLAYRFLFRVRANCGDVLPYR